MNHGIEVNHFKQDEEQSCARSIYPSGFARLFQQDLDSLDSLECWRIAFAQTLTSVGYSIYCDVKYIKRRWPSLGRFGAEIASQKDGNFPLSKLISEANV